MLHIFCSPIYQYTLYILRFRLYNARGMNSLSFPTTHFIAIWQKKRKCMGNVPTFSAVLFFEVEVATGNRHFHSERIEIAKQGKKHKKCARCWGIQKTLVYCRSSPVGDTRMLQSRMLHFFAPEKQLLNSEKNGGKNVRIYKSRSVSLEVPTALIEGD